MAVVKGIGSGFGGDGGFWYLGTDGKPHHVDPWNPELMAEVNAGMTLISVAGTLKNTTLAEQVASLGQKMVNAHLGAMQAQARAIG